MAALQNRPNRHSSQGLRLCRSSVLQLLYQSPCPHLAPCAWVTHCPQQRACHRWWFLHPYDINVPNQNILTFMVTEALQEATLQCARDGRSGIPAPPNNIHVTKQAPKQQKATYIIFYYSPAGAGTMSCRWPSCPCAARMPPG